MTYEALLSPYFGKLGTAIGKSFVRQCSGAIDACSSSTHEIARHVSYQTGRSFNTSEKGINYLLDNDNLQIDDRFWRRHIKMVFDMLEDQNLLPEGEPVCLQVDFTSNKDDFLILCASIIVIDRAIPLFFTMRNYPKRKGSYNHAKMEQAFIKGLRHILSNKYQYVIVADRGFGNKRFIDYCKASSFSYVIRIEPNMRVQYCESTGILRDAVTTDGRSDVFVQNWDCHMQVYRHSLDGKVWYIVSNINNIGNKDVAKAYANRFKIEKCFQDLKSSGFNIERSRIRKYDRYKRLLAICVVSHSVLVMLGQCVKQHMPAFLKNSPLCGAVILAHFQSESALYSSLKKGKYITSSEN